MGGGFRRVYRACTWLTILGLLRSRYHTDYVPDRGSLFQLWPAVWIIAPSNRRDYKESMIRKAPDIQFHQVFKGPCIGKRPVRRFYQFLVIITYFQLQRADPLNTPVLKSMQEQLARLPEDLVLRQQIRELDLLARKSFLPASHRSGQEVTF